MDWLKTEMLCLKKVKMKPERTVNVLNCPCQVQDSYLGIPDAEITR